MTFIYPIERYKDKNDLDYLGANFIPDNFLWGNRSYFFFKNARAAIHTLALQYKLTRADEVAIITTSDANYVSTCVSGTLLNYCAVSRVLSERTKLIYVIHEFGQPHASLHDLVKIANEYQIPLVEDCAHTLDSMIGNQQIGTQGDYAIYSLAKHFPIKEGGLLVGKNITPSSEWYDKRIASFVEKEFYSFLPYLPALSLRRKENFQYFRNMYPNARVVFEYNDSVTPFYLVFITENYLTLSEIFEQQKIHCGRLYVKNWFALSTQPFMCIDDKLKIRAAIGKYL